MDAVRDFFDNEKGIVAVLFVLVPATIFVILNKMTIDQWQSTATWTFGIYAGTTAAHQSVVAISTKTTGTPSFARASARKTGQPVDPT